MTQSPLERNQQDESNWKKEEDGLPKIEFLLNTAWKKGVIMAIAYSPIWVVMLILLKVNLDRNNPNIMPIYGINVFLGIFCCVPLIVGLLRRNVLLVFSVDKSQDQLIYESYWSNIRVAKKVFRLEEIYRFEVLLRIKHKYRQIFECKTLALTFKTRSPQYFTKPKQEPEVMAYVRQLNELLASNTELDSELLNKILKPYLPPKEKRMLKIIMALILISIIIVIIAIIVVVVLVSFSG